MSTTKTDPAVTIYSQGGWYKWLIAKGMARFSPAYDAIMARRKRSLFSNLHGNVLEIGPGTGPNLAYYPPDAHWIGIEPNLHMHRYILKEARRLDMDFELLDGAGEWLPVEDGSMDAVVGTMVLCSVRDPNATLREILRVLKPGGQFAFIEHVAGSQNTRLRKLQNLVQPVWTWIADGCHPNRETWATIEQIGFAKVRIEHFSLSGGLFGPHIAGMAIK